MLKTDDIKKAKPRDKDYRLSAGKGLSLIVRPNGTKLWRFRYRIDGREKTLSIGTWPEIDLKSAELARDEARIKLQRHQIDPSAEKQAKKHSITDSFGSIAREWLGIGAPTGNRRSSPPKQATIDRMEQRLEAFVLPWLGNRPIKNIEIADLKRVLDRISDRGTIDTAHRVRSVVDRVYRYAITTGRAERNIAADLKGALKLTPVASHAAITDPSEFGGLLRAIDGYIGQPTVMAALKLAPLLFQRPGELRHAEWQEIDIEDALWSIPACKMKNGLDHTVPLSSQAIDVIEELRPITGHGRYLFPGLRSEDKPISDNTLNAALRRLGYDNKTHVAHGFRSSASTLLHELGFDPDVIDQQLAHKRQGVSAVYNRSHLLPQRREMMQAWSDHLDTIK